MAVDVERQVDEAEGVVVGVVVEACKKNPFISFLESGLSNTPIYYVCGLCPVLSCRSARWLWLANSVCTHKGHLICENLVRKLSILFEIACQFKIVPFDILELLIFLKVSNTVGESVLHLSSIGTSALVLPCF